jgi:hypothetical protein
MHTSGLVVTFVADPAQAGVALQELVAAGPFVFESAAGRCRAAVLEAPNPGAARDWHEWAATRTGVESVEVVFVHWDETEVEEVEREGNHVGT